MSGYDWHKLCKQQTIILTMKYVDDVACGPMSPDVNIGTASVVFANCISSEF